MINRSESDKIYNILVEQAEATNNELQRMSFHKFMNQPKVRFPFKGAREFEGILHKEPSSISGYRASTESQDESLETALIIKNINKKLDEFSKI